MKALTMARRELRSAFDSPVAYVVVALIPALTAVFFFVMGPFFDEGVASLRRYFALMPGLLIVAAPAVTMRLWAEERRSGTEELLFTYPFRISELVVGKFLGALAILSVALLFTLGVPLTVSALGDLDWGPVWGGYLSTLLLGSACLAIGLFFSACTRNQIVAWILGVVVLLACNLLAVAATATAMPASLGRILLAADFGLRFQSITRGVLAAEDVVFYLAVTVFFLFLNVLVLDVRRWR